MKELVELAQSKLEGMQEAVDRQDASRIMEIVASFNRAISQATVSSNPELSEKAKAFARVSESASLTRIVNAVVEAAYARRKGIKPEELLLGPDECWFASQALEALEAEVDDLSTLKLTGAYVLEDLQAVMKMARYRLAKTS